MVYRATASARMSGSQSFSRSVDEKIEEPRKIQEKRELPWSQAFLEGGIHGPIPGTFGIFVAQDSNLVSLMAMFP